MRMLQRLAAVSELSWTNGTPRAPRGTLIREEEPVIPPPTN
ncbi:hypothetical protein Leryth_015156 [Lithospermum erythrorhizon]|nr:hypothetical protein Leryth_015156 [Lithospermum erythrorhizon]